MLVIKTKRHLSGLCLLVCAGAAVGVPGPWTGVTGPPVPNARVEGGTGGTAGWLELDAVTAVGEVEEGPTGVVVPATGAPAVGSPGRSSPWVAGGVPPRSMKRERSFLSSMWMSSTLPGDSMLASHLVDDGDFIDLRNILL